MYVVNHATGIPQYRLFKVNHPVIIKERECTAPIWYKFN